MDFGSVLYTAHKNEKSANKEIKCYKTKFDPPKKEAKPTKPNLSANIQKYLQKRDEEERRKSEEEKRKKEGLLALRSQDKKAFKRVQTMLKRTKSANKSVMEDAIDDVNTVVTMSGPQQCDEDDYGYVSKEASDFYAKMMDKYANMPPEEPKFSQSKKTVPKDLNAAKDRVRAALQRAEEEEMMPHKRKRKSKSDKNDEENGEEDDEGKRKLSRESSPAAEPKPKKPKKMAPPPIDFSSLLKLAEQKQFEPIQIETKADDEERPMTKRQKLEYERELESRRRKEEREAMRIAALSKRTKSSESADRKDKPNGLGRIPKKTNVADSKLKQETKRRNSVESDDDQNSRFNESNSDRQKTKYTSDSNRHRNYDGSHDYKKESSILKSSLLKSDDRKPLKPTQPMIASNKIKSRNHSMSDDERSETSDSGYDRSHNSDNLREHKSSSMKDYHKPSSGSARRYSDQNGYKKYSNADNECTDSQSSNDSRKFQSSKSQSGSNVSHQKYKPQMKYRPDLDKNKPEKYRPEKQILKKTNSSSGRERSYSPDNSDRYPRSRKQSGSESDGENKYRPSKKEGSSYSSSYREKPVKSDGGRSQSPGPSSEYKKRDTQHLHCEPSGKKPSFNKIKKLSNLFEGSDEEPSSHRDQVKIRKENGDRKSKSFSESERQKPSSESKFKIPKSIKPECERTKPSENDSYKSSGSSKSSSSSSSKPSNHDSLKHKPGNQKSEKTSTSSKIDGDKTRFPIEKNNNKPCSPSEPTKSEAKEISKKPSSLKAEEVLKKSASVWSKPCNTSSTSSAQRSSGGLSESQLQRLREMNKKPTPSKPTDERSRPGPLESRTLNGRPNPRDERKSDGRPVKPGLQGKQSLLMKAAAERGAMIKAQMAASRSNDSSSRLPVSKSSTSSVSSRPSGQPISDSRQKVGENKSRQFPPSDLKPKQFPPSDLKPRQFPPKDIRPRQFPPPDVKRKPKPRRIIEDDSEDEYDSDMDSFIDDGCDLRPEDISKEIQQIFGYDKSRYVGMDDDDECMESNFGQIDKEELISLRIGAKEDLEELMKEEARKKRAKQRKLMEKGRR